MAVFLVVVFLVALAMAPSIRLCFIVIHIPLPLSYDKTAYSLLEMRGSVNNNFSYSKIIIIYTNVVGRERLWHYILDLTISSFESMANFWLKSV